MTETTLWLIEWWDKDMVPATYPPRYAGPYKSEAAAGQASHDMVTRFGRTVKTKVLVSYDPEDLPEAKGHETVTVTLEDHQAAAKRASDSGVLLWSVACAECGVMHNVSSDDQGYVQGAQHRCVTCQAAGA